MHTVEDIFMVLIMKVNYSLREHLLRHFLVNKTLNGVLNNMWTNSVC